MAGEREVFIVHGDTVSLVSDPDESFRVGANAVFAFDNDHCRGTKSLIFADRRNGAIVLSAWLDGKEYPCPDTIGAEEVTALYHSARTGHVILAQKSQVKVFRYDESNHWQGVEAKFNFHWDISQICAKRFVAEKTYDAFVCIDKHGNHTFLCLDGNKKWTESQIDVSAPTISPLHFTGFNETNTVTAISHEDRNYLSWSAGELQVKTTVLDDPKTILLPKSRWLSNYFFILRHYGIVRIADIRADAIHWNAIDVPSITAMGLREDSVDQNEGASLLLASGNIVYEHDLHNLGGS